MESGEQCPFTFSPFVLDPFEEVSLWSNVSGSKTDTLSSSDKDMEEVMVEVADEFWEDGAAGAIPVEERAGAKATDAFGKMAMVVKLAAASAGCIAYP